MNSCYQHALELLSQEPNFGTKLYTIVMEKMRFDYWKK